MFFYRSFVPFTQCHPSYRCNIRLFFSRIHFPIERCLSVIKEYTLSYSCTCCTHSNIRWQPSSSIALLLFTSFFYSWTVAILTLSTQYWNVLPSKKQIFGHTTIVLKPSTLLVPLTNKLYVPYLAQCPIESHLKYQESNIRINSMTRNLHNFCL
jgi:hypothetical protein